ncbi:hypothetical protein LOK49_LG13G02928 [Camellia lanceoleosa]|uniref:Uncharacterized protein n=1 Tax=Camellia lanceoleosa TaxID=1840588 RepID=A0ACC0FMM5_9ERIC|nr:hypothetical protein LOK49_LG13G02928 [Camellia lanceoleosa]
MVMIVIISVFPVGVEVPLGYGVHDADVSVEGLGPEELREKFSHFLHFVVGRSLVGGREDLVDGARPPRRHQLVLVGEEELVSLCTAHHHRRCSEQRCFEGLGREFSHPLVYELLRLPFPAIGEEFEAFAEKRQPSLARREVAGGCGGGFGLLVKENCEGKGEEYEEDSKGKNSDQRELHLLGK